MQENMTAVVETNEVPAVATADSSPVETTATVEAPKSKRQRKAERKAKAAAEAKAKGKPARKGSKPKGEKPAVAPTVRDAFGNRLGTSSAAINATILGAKVPLTVREIHERTGADGRANVGATRQHCLWLLERGHIKMKDGAYIKASKPARKARASKPAGESAPTGENETGE